MVIEVPGTSGVPGAKVAPLAIVTVFGSTVPSPVKVAPALTLTADELVIAPFTSRVPSSMLVGPV